MLSQIINLFPSERSEMSIEIFRIQIRFVVLISLHIVDPLSVSHEVNGFAAMQRKQTRTGGGVHTAPSLINKNQRRSTVESRRKKGITKKEVQGK